MERDRQQTNEPEQIRLQPEAAERQLLPSALEIIEREVRLYDPELPPVTGEAYSREIDEISRLQEERDKKGSVRDNLITDLYWDMITAKDPPSVSPAIPEHLTLQEFHQFRSRVERMSEEEIREENRQLKEARERQWEEWRERHKNDPPTIARH